MKTSRSETCEESVYDVAALKGSRYSRVVAIWHPRTTTSALYVAAGYVDRGEEILAPSSYRLVHGKMTSLALVSSHTQDTSKGNNSDNIIIIAMVSPSLIHP